MQCSDADGIGLAGSALARLQFADVLDDLVDLLVGESRRECRHRAFLAILDAVANKVIVALGIHQLRTLAGSTAPVGMTKAAGRCEQLLDIDFPAVG